MLTYMQIFDIAKKHSKMAQLYVKYPVILCLVLIVTLQISFLFPLKNSTIDVVVSYPCRSWVREGHEQEGCEAASPASVLKHNK